MSETPQEPEAPAEAQSIRGGWEEAQPNPYDGDDYDDAQDDGTPPQDEGDDT